MRKRARCIKFQKPPAPPPEKQYWHQEPFGCDNCGHVASLDAYDVGGLEDGVLACNDCGHIGPMVHVGYADPTKEVTDA